MKKILRFAAILLLPAFMIVSLGGVAYANQHEGAQLNGVQPKAPSVLDNVCAGPFPNNEIPTACADMDNQGVANNSITGPDGIISKATNIITFIVGIAALIVIIISGLQFILATGDPSRIANARNALLYALIGIGVAVFAQVIVRFVVNRL